MYEELWATLTEPEIWWIKYQPFLASRGYQLRQRFQPGWVPSWTKPDSNFDPLEGNYSDFEDYHPLLRANVLDAIRISDGVKVVLRQSVCKMQTTTSVRLLDIVPLPDDDSIVLIVIPFLRSFKSPIFRHLREVTEAMGQYFRGLSFLHEHDVAHRDACAGNMLMDATNVIPGGYHFSYNSSEDGNYHHRIRWRDRCAVAPVQYYFIDFGLSSFFPEGEEAARDVGIFGQDKTVPELSDTVPYNPFKVDIYQLGNVFVKLSKKHPAIWRFFCPLLESMTRSNPDERPSAAHVVVLFDQACARIPPAVLTEKLTHICESPLYTDDSESDPEYELVEDSKSEL
ncbi:Protein kinase domain-containing protein [Mycena indigotica]|uniref:Protein kinase domain-containing protein n=1 Tax=Mycena indigotica TaxID=2126181 RepID=A0A8H6WBG2_9AGAR|nr:Protein kinase domain-containing protein [Mycena indigotica]KAF7306339.1 Protein kinase domain-containing protein [Mycena indigotica]